MTGLMPHNHGVLEVLYPKVPDLQPCAPTNPTLPSNWARPATAQATLVSGM